MGESKNDNKKGSTPIPGTCKAENGSQPFLFCSCPTPNNLNWSDNHLENHL